MEEKENDCSTSIPPPQFHHRLSKAPRNLNSVISSTSYCSSQTQGLPDLSTCHSCGIRDENLYALDSQWRVVFLCNACRGLIRQFAACSYCFSRFTTVNKRDEVVMCRSCHCRVHLWCVPIPRGYIALSDFDHVSFTCVDCCAIPRRQIWNPPSLEASMEELTRKVSFSAKNKVALASTARAKALNKAEEARIAMELAFDAILFARDTSFADEALALRLNRMMKGSPRILYSATQENLGVSHGIRKGGGGSSDHSMSKKQRTTSVRVHEEVGFSTKYDASAESKKCASSNRNSITGTGIAEEEKKNAGHCDGGAVEVTVDGKDDPCLVKIVTSDEESTNTTLAFRYCRESTFSNNTIDASERGRGAGEDSRKLLEKKSCMMPDRFKLNYSKRPSTSQGPMSSNSLKSLQCHKMRSSEASASANAQSTIIPMHKYKS